MPISTDESRSLKSEKLRRLYRSFPDAYAADRLGAHLTEDQSATLFSLVGNRRTAVKASHAIGKTFTAAIANNWWYDCWDEHIGYITAPTWPQALGLTFKEIIKQRREHNLGGIILESGIVRDPDKAVQGAHYIKALNAESGEGFQGEHAAPILLTYEEAVGVPSYIWEAGDGLLTHPECRLLAIANPTAEDNRFGKACQSSLFNVLTVCGLRHPNIEAEMRGDEPPFPKAVRLTWIREMIEKECEEVAALHADAFEFNGRFYLPNAVFQGRVLGDFPSQADQQVIPRGWLTNLPRLPLDIGAAIGCDVARKGTDRSTVASRSGPCILQVREIRQMDCDVLAGALIEVARETAGLVHVDPKAIPIRVDVTGGLGVAPVLFLLAAGYNAIEVNASSKAIESERYPNKRSELWFTLRERARLKDLDLSRLPQEMREKVVRELSTPTWEPNSRGQKVVEEKKAIRKRLGESPDIADAVNLAFDGTGGDWKDALVPQAEMESFELESASVGRVW
jgi:hypothetical protein